MAETTHSPQHYSVLRLKSKFSFTVSVPDQAVSHPASSAGRAASAAATLVALLRHRRAVRGLSLDEFIREVLEWALTPSDESDPLFADDAVYAGSAPADLSAHHDRYLYGEDR